MSSFKWQKRDYWRKICMCNQSKKSKKWAVEFSIKETNKSNSRLEIRFLFKVVCTTHLNMSNCVLWPQNYNCIKVWFDHDSKIFSHFFISHTIFIIIKVVVNLRKYLLSWKLLARHICTCQNCAFLNTKLQVCRGVLWTCFKGLDSDFFHFSKYIYYQQKYLPTCVNICYVQSCLHYIFVHAKGTFLKTK